MFGLKKSCIHGKSRTEKAVFNGFGWGNGQLRPAEQNNCDYLGGSLKRGIGLAPYMDEENDEMTYYGMPTAASAQVFTVVDRGERLPQAYLIDGDGFLYRRQENGGCVKKGYVGDRLRYDKLQGEDGVEYHLLTASEGVYATIDGEQLRAISEGETVRGGCVCGGRYFYVLEKGELRYSAPLKLYMEEDDDPTGGGVIYLPVNEGRVVGLQAFDGEAYVFMEKGIYRLSVSADARGFCLRKLVYAGGTPIIGSITATGRGVLFLTADGLYMAKGDSAKRFCAHLPIGVCDSEYACKVGSCEGLAIVEYREKLGGDKFVRRVVIDAEREDGYFTEAYAPLCEGGISAMSGKIYRFAKEGEGLLRGENPRFVSERLRFGTDKKKRLKKLRLKGVGEVLARVRCDGAVRNYSAVFAGGESAIRLTEKGKDFFVELYPKEGARVDCLEIEYSVER